MNALTSARSRRVLSALAFSMAMQMTGLVMILPLFARRFDSFGASAQALAVSSVAYALTGTLFAPFIGMLADRRGRRPVILLSLACSVLAFCGFLLAASAPQLIAFRGLAGVAVAGLLPIAASIVGDVAPQSQRARWIGIVNGGASAGWIVGPLLGGLLYDRFGYAVPCSASIALAVGALLLAVFWVHETRSPVAQPARPHSAWTDGWRALAARPAFILPVVVSFGAMLAWAFIEPRFMFYVYEDLRWSSSLVGLLMSAYGVACTSALFALGHLSDRLGRRSLLVLGLALFSLQFIGLVLFRDAFRLVVSFVLAGLGNGLFDPALHALILDSSPADQTAGAMGVNALATALGRLLGPLLVVAFPLSAVASFIAAFAIVGVLVLASGVVLRARSNG